MMSEAAAPQDEIIPLILILVVGIVLLPLTGITYMWPPGQDNAPLVSLTLFTGSKKILV